MKACPQCGEAWKWHDSLNRQACLEKAVAEHGLYRKALEEIANHAKASERLSPCDEHCADEMVRVAREALRR